MPHMEAIIHGGNKGRYGSFYSVDISTLLSECVNGAGSEQIIGLIVFGEARK